MIMPQNPTPLLASSKRTSYRRWESKQPLRAQSRTTRDAPMMLKSRAHGKSGGIGKTREDIDYVYVVNFAIS